MSVFSWISIFILLLVMILFVVKIPKQMPQSDFGKRIMALSPMILAILLVIIFPNNLLNKNEALSSFIRIIIPFVGAAFSFPLILKVNKEIKKEN